MAAGGKKWEKSRGKKQAGKGRGRRGPCPMSPQARRLMASRVGLLCRGVVTEADRHRRRRRGSFIGTAELRAALAKLLKGRGGAVRGRAA